MLETGALDPPEIHPEEHRRPVLGFGAAGAGIDGDDRAQPVVGTREQTLLLERIDLVTQGRHFARGLGLHPGIGFLDRQVMEDAGLVHPLASRFPRLDQGARALQRRDRAARLVGLVPEAGIGHLAFQAGDLGFLLRDVKDTP